MNILVIVAHPDDEVLGCGATIAKHVKNGDDVYVCALCELVSARTNKPKHDKFMKQVNDAEKVLGVKETMFFNFPNIKFNTVPHLELVQAIEKSILKFKPELIYTHHKGDVNIDHQVVFDATIAAIRLPERCSADLPVNMIKKVLTFEISSSTEWAAPLAEFAFLPNVFVDVTKTFETKIAAAKCYEAILKDTPHPRSVRNLEALAYFRGSQVSIDKAEAFMLIREIN